MRALMQPQALTTKTRLLQAVEMEKHPAASCRGHTKHTSMEFIVSLESGYVFSRHAWPGLSHEPKCQLTQQRRHLYT